MHDWDAERRRIAATLAAIHDDLDVARNGFFDCSALERHATAALQVYRDRLEHSAATHDLAALAFEDAAHSTTDDTFQWMAYLYGAQAHRAGARDDRNLLPECDDVEPPHLELVTDDLDVGHTASRVPAPPRIRGGLPAPPSHDAP